MSASRDSKAIEQARLSELFKSLASRRPRPQSLSTVAPSFNASTDKRRSTNDTDATSADQVLRHLSKSPAISHERDTLANGTVTGTRPRRNTVASIPTAIQTRQSLLPVSASTDTPPRLPPVPQADEDIDTDNDDCGDLEAEAEAALAKFPLTATTKYPFTFKLMIYKLYKKEDWVKTIKEMLEKSKNEFKPLAEKEKDVVYAGSKAEEESMPPPNKDSGAVRFKLVPPSPGPSGRQRRTSGVGVGPAYTTHIRQRSMSTLGGTGGATSSLYASRPAATYPKSPFPRSPKSPKSPPPFSPTSPSFSLTATTSNAASAEPGVRVLKKRCVGRRRSMSLSVPSPLGIANNENQEKQPRISGTWVYNAAVSRSASERPAAANPSSLAKYLPNDPPPSPTGGRFPGCAPLGSRNLNVPNANGHMLQSKEATPKMMTMMSPAPTMMIPLSQVAGNKERLVARRRAMTVGNVNNDGPIMEQRKAAKRPFAG
ncbi:hypothetical protein D9619_006572 [Psilocybe cf. subviscida]|uniref:Uncharacterized protein n=1 Tax=Psilocybe cf. subviscida TaxID=2480587 RepID=A0A8H5B4A3_9AGAR|nr:hypothetical protein D9619_006572 [Psilocybe cf. subviscida]